MAGVAMLVGIAMLCHCNIKVRILLTNGYVQHTIAGSLGNKFKVEHARTIGIGCCRIGVGCCL